MTWPSETFPQTPAWFVAAVAEAIDRAGVTASKWAVPLHAIGRYESNYNVAAGFKKLWAGDPTVPVGWEQQGVSMMANARELYPGLFAGIVYPQTDPVAQGLVAILHIDSRLTVTGGYGGIGTLDGSKGLLPRTDRGPGNVLRAWTASPATFDVEAARTLYEGY